MSSLSIIVATDSNNGIGIANTLPWHLPEDLAHFKRTTSGHAIIMGRKTFESIGRPLPQRRNIVISRNPEWKHDGVEIYSSLEAAQAQVQSDNAFIIGGAEIYAQALQLASKLIVTQIHASYECDAFFPKIDPSHWIETKRERHTSAHQQLAFDVVEYQKMVK
jgi:dihydrofolate reductase